MKKISLLLLSLAFAAGCKKEETTIVDATNDYTSATENTAQSKEKEGAGIDAFAQQFAIRRKEVVHQVKNLSADEANKLYETYLAENEKLLLADDEKQLEFIGEHYDAIYNKTQKDKIVNQKIKVLHQAGLEFYYLGEGLIEIRTQPDFYKDIFQDKVSEDYRAYIALIAQNDKVLWLDGDVIVPWEKIGDNVLAWEKLFNLYPNSAIKEKIKKEYDWFRWLYIVGTENAEVKQYNQTTFLPKAKKAFEKMIAEHPESRVAKIARIALTNTQNGNEYLETMQTVCNTVK